jgi:hypothetical protein
MSQPELLNDAGDADLLTRVGIALTLRLRHTLHAVHIRVEKGVVTLQGVVPSFYDRQLAIEITRRVAGVLRVIDELSVNAVQPVNRVHENPSRAAATSALRGAGTESARRASDAATQSSEQPVFSWRAFVANAATVVRSLFLLMALMLAVGCGKGPERETVPVFPATGKITFKGQPIPGASITLHPVTPVENVPKPRANVAKDGTFNIRTYGSDTGAPEGDYKVTVLWYKPIKNGPDFTSGPNVIPQKFTQPETTSIQVKIAAGQNNLPTIQL